MKKSFIYSILNGLLLFFFLTGLQADFHEELKQIPQEDQKILTDFFHYLVTESSFAYTLFGNKPISFEEFSEDLNKNTLENLLYPYADTILGYGWTVWQKYQHLFNHPHFVFKKVPSRSGYTFIVLINKTACLSVIQTHLEDFKSVLGQNKSTENIFEDITGNKYFYFEDSIANNQLLLGILLGYGRENGLMFLKRDQICTQIIKRNTSPILRSFQFSDLALSAMRLLKLYEKTSSSEWQENNDCISLPLLCKKLENIQEITEPFNPPAKHWINKIGAPEFLSLKNSSERTVLEKNYRTTLGSVKNIGIQVTLLSTILKRLTYE